MAFFPDINVFDSIHHNKIAYAVIMCACITVIGTVGYMLIEGFNLIEGLYMTVITLTTVGFGEVRPLSDVGRGFTAVLIIFGFITLAFTGHMIAESLLESVWSRKGEKKKMKKRISHLYSHYIICGYGRVGMSTAELFHQAKASFVIIENNSKQCQEIKKKGYLFVEGDATNEKVLKEAGVKSAKGVLALLNSDPDNLFIALSARELNPLLHIVARADDVSAENKIYQAGADKVISPFASAGKRIADRILKATGKNQLSDNLAITPELAPQWITIHEGSSMEGKSLWELSQEMNREILGLRREERDTLQPEPEITLETGDMVLILDEATEKDERQIDLGPRKVVIVDDNPVILRLFTRLFQKAGFIPLTAPNGEDGIKLIEQEKPEAAVVDYLLPKLSGLELCTMVRTNPDLEEIILVLFTSDSSVKIHKEALEAGADEVVLKSPDAHEIINQVKKLIKNKDEQKEKQLV